jgi:hypothetical protein
VGRTLDHHVFHSVHRMGEWQVTLNNRAVATHSTQAACEEDARARAQAAGIPARAVLHRADGSIKIEHAFGLPVRWPLRG